MAKDSLQERLEKERVLEKIGLKMIGVYTKNYTQNIAEFFVIAYNKTDPAKSHPECDMKARLKNSPVAFNLFQARHPRERQHPKNMNRINFQLTRENYRTLIFQQIREENRFMGYEARMT